MVNLKPHAQGHATDRATTSSDINKTQRFWDEQYAIVKHGVYTFKSYSKLIKAVIEICAIYFALSYLEKC